MIEPGGKIFSENDQGLKDASYCSPMASGIEGLGERELLLKSDVMGGIVNSGEPGFI